MSTIDSVQYLPETMNDSGKVIKAKQYNSHYELENIAIREGVTLIEDGAFSKCTNLKTVEFADSISEIQGNPFIYDHSIEYYSASSNHLYLATVDGVLFSKPDKRLISYPCYRSYQETRYQIPKGIKIIEKHAFESTKLTSVTIPDTVTEIGENAFWLSDLGNIRIPSSVKTIGKEAFHHSNIKSVTISEGLEEIQDYAFRDCRRLQKINIPSSTERIGKNPFHWCHKLEVIEGSPDSAFFEVIDGALFSKMDHRLICYPGGKKDACYKIPEGTKCIDERAFQDNNHLVEVIIPEGLEIISMVAFAGCKKLRRISFPQSIKRIEDSSFSSCISLKNVILPETDFDLHKHAFDPGTLRKSD